MLDEVGFEKPKNSDNILLLVDKVEKGKATLVQGEYELELANDQRDWCRNIRVKFEAHKNINSAWSFSGSVHYSAQVTYAPNSSSCYDKDNVSFGVNRPHTDKELSKLKTDLEKLISQQSKLWEEKSANELNYRLPEFAMGMPWTVVQVDTSERHGSAAIFQKYNVLAIVRLILNQESLVIQDVSFSVK
ncbi:hypothetical protein [Pseudoalteromonas piscicida]|uniref:hypothetical protein n=1 Tax=Pseudoalteromonas piscicida TaxID=43662 RepID=UPI003099620A